MVAFLSGSIRLKKNHIPALITSQPATAPIKGNKNQKPIMSI
jgi:hypothetical protein